MGLNCVPADFKINPTLWQIPEALQLLLPPRDAMNEMTHLLKTFEHNVRSCPLAAPVISRGGWDTEKFPILALLQWGL